MVRKLLFPISSSKQNSDKFPQIFLSQNLSTPGWYKIKERSAGDFSVAKYSYSDIYSIDIATVFMNNASFACSLKCICAYDDFKMNVLSRSDNAKVISKIREVYYASKQRSYLEVYYTPSIINTVIVAISNLYFKKGGINFEMDEDNFGTVIFEHEI